MTFSFFGASGLAQLDTSSRLIFPCPLTYLGDIMWVLHGFRKISVASVVVFLCLTPIQALADCRGCCSGHGGLICIDGVTQCVNDTPLSQTCLDKECNICEEVESSSDEISIASFNIQVFGRTKASKPEVMEILVRTISKFDIVAIQEIRDKTGVNSRCQRPGEGNGSFQTNHGQFRVLIERYTGWGSLGDRIL